MSKESRLIVTKYKDRLSCFQMLDRKAESIFMCSDSALSVGDIYIGKVKQVKSDINAAFIELPGKIMGFLPLEKVWEKGVLNRQFKGTLQENDEIAVIVEKEPLKTKLTALSMRLTITGSFSVVTSDDSAIHVSNKLSKTVSKSFIEMLSKDYSDESGLGLVVRTNASLTDYEACLSEARKNREFLLKVIRTMKTRTVFSKLYSAKPEFINRIMDLPYDSYTEIITDIPEYFKVMTVFLDDRKDKLRFYQEDKISLTALYSLERAYREATDEKVYLNCGGYLVIEPTEALTVIDVNSGKADKKKDKADNIDLVNTEAAVEIARQLKLRNLSGIILVDFINYSDKDSEDKLISLLKKLLKDDIMPSKYIDMTALGLVEITRSKKYPSIYECAKNN